MEKQISETLERQIRNGQADEQALRHLAEQTLSPAQQQAMQSLLRDPQALEKLMQSDRAQALLHKLQP